MRRSIVLGLALWGSALACPCGQAAGAAAAPAGAERRLQFAGRAWVVKSSPATRAGPGPNYFSDSAQNVWLDAAGRLHLKITRRTGRWYAAEVYAAEELGYGTYRFVVEGWIDRLDPNVVFAGFTYSDRGSEADIEFARWGDKTRRQNAQYVVQPRAPHAWTLKLGTPQSAHSLAWQPDRIDFASRAGDWQQGSTGEVATWTCTDPVVLPDGERMRFNLWLYRGKPPRDGREVEVVVSSFEFIPPEAILAQQGGLSIRSANPARGPVTCSFALAQPARVQLRVVDVRGRVVHRLSSLDLAAGRHDLTWDPFGRGLPIPSGVYYLCLDSGSTRRVARVVVVR